MSPTASELLDREAPDTPLLVTPSARQKILILSSNTGGGHRSAAQALEASFSIIEPSCALVKIAQVLEEAHSASRMMANLYNYLLRHRQDWMQYYYWLINHLKPNESRLILEGAGRYGRELVSRYAPDVLVSVHPMTQHLFAYVLKKLRLLDKLPLTTVVTDPCAGFWRGWACDAVQSYYVASDEAANQLLDYGVAQDKISVQGMPVHPKFMPASLAQQACLRAELGLDPERFTVFCNAGWIGGGNIPRLFEALMMSELPIQMLYVAGQNDALVEQAHRVAQNSPIPVRIFGYTDAMERLMNASDVLVSKLGGLTTFEALSCGLPMLADALTPPMPQERQTGAFLERYGAGALIEHPQRAVALLRELMTSETLLAEMQFAARQVARPGASTRIAEDILKTIAS